MKATELRKHATCGVCKKPILTTGLPFFSVVTVRRFGVDIAAVGRHDGLAAALGSGRVAEAMGPDEDLAKELDTPATLTVCASCNALDARPVAELVELATGESEN